MQFHESIFCPVTCSLGELEKAIKAALNKERRDFLLGVKHARILLAAGLAKPEVAR